jgi:hypothetical protein
MRQPAIETGVTEMNVTIKSERSYSPIGDMGFSASWQDETHRYHVWIGIRPDVEGERPPYPVKIEPTIYKNPLDNSRYAPPTIKMDLDAAKNAKIKTEIKRLATYDTLIALFNAGKIERDAQDAMWEEADRLNAIFNAWKLLDTATVDEKMTLGLI